MSNAERASGDTRLRLSVGTLLDKDYRVEGEIGAGGFGITYRGRDSKLGRPVAIKEYFPADIGSRDGTMSVHPLTQSQGEIFGWGRDGFIREAQMLASFRHPAIVRVMRYFEANNTAYMVLEYEAGPSLGKWLAALERRPTQAELDGIASGLMDALETIHKERLIHRDIAPDNIIIRPDLSPVLLDFGAARYEIAETQAVAARSFAAVIKAHYSPIEQRSTEKRNRGPWSDIYSLAATLYRAVTGQMPPDAFDRLGGETDPLVPAATAAKGSYRPSFLAAIDRALSIKRQERPQTIAEFRRLALGTEPASPQIAPAAAGAQGSPPAATAAGPLTFSQLPDQRSPSARGDYQRPAIAASLGLAAIIGMWMISSAQRPSSPAQPPRPPVAIAPPQVDRSQWNLLRDRMATAISESKAMVESAKAAVNRSDWKRAQEIIATGERQADILRPDAVRLASTAVDDGERRHAANALQELSSFERALTDVRQQTERGLQASAAPKPPERAPDPPVKPPPAPSFPAPPLPTASLWSHNGSTLRLVAEGASRRFLYVTPRQGLLVRGVRAGTLLFDGEKNGDVYSGRSRVYHATCGAYPYEVTGPVSADQRRVTMSGQKPILSDTCRVERTEPDELVFEYVSNEVTGAKEPSPVAAPSKSIFDGHWYSPEWRYSYRLRNGIGTATATNSKEFNVGDTIIKIDATGPTTFAGSQVYRDGKWYGITGRLANDRLHISGEKNVSWHMERIN